MRFQVRDPLERARRQVLRGESIVGEQELLVAELRRDRLPSRVAEEVLETFRRGMDLMRDDLALLEAMAAGLGLSAPPRYRNVWLSLPSSGLCV